MISEWKQINWKIIFSKISVFKAGSTRW